MPQLSRRTVIFASDNKKLDEYLQALWWKRVEPFFVSIPHRNKWLEEKSDVEEDN